MTGEKDPRDVMQAEHDAGLSDHPAFRAPAEMPGVEEIARLLFQRSVYHGYDADTLKREWMRTEGFHRGNARAILALFAPILAEKEREKAIAIEEAIENAGREALWRDQLRKEEARALAAEAALAAERERCAKVAWLQSKQGATHDQSATAIRAEGG